MEKRLIVLFLLLCLLIISGCSSTSNSEQPSEQPEQPKQAEIIKNEVAETSKKIEPTKEQIKEQILSNIAELSYDTIESLDLIIYYISHKEIYGKFNIDVSDNFKSKKQKEQLELVRDFKENFTNVVKNLGYKHNTSIMLFESTGNNETVLYQITTDNLIALGPELHRAINENEEYIRLSFSSLDKQIYEFMEDIWDEYEFKYGIDGAVSKVVLETSKEYKKPIIEVFRIYRLIQESNSQYSIKNENEIDAMNLNTLKDAGFNKKGSKWYYKGSLVNMGTPLPMPVSMKPLEAEQGKEIDVKLDLDVDINELKYVTVTLNTNLPDQTSVHIHIYHEEDNCHFARDFYPVKEGKIIIGPMKHPRQPAGRFKSETYNIDIETPLPLVQSKNVKDIIGKKGENLIGALVKTDKDGYNRIFYKTTLNVD